jgi:membrane fusion protein, heavy metal efflux system
MRGFRMTILLLLGAALPLVTAAPETRAAEGEYDCLVVPSQMADLSFGTSGLLATVKVERGDPVSKGDVLATLDATVENSNLEIAKARGASAAARESADVQLELSSKQYDRSRRLFESKNLPQAKLEEALTALQNAKLRVQEAKENQVLFDLDVTRTEVFLKLKSLVSPFSGVVVEKYFSPGEYLENKPVLRVATVDPVAFDAVLPAELRTNIASLQQITISLEQSGLPVVKAKATRIDPYVDAASGTFRLRLEAANPGGRILPGYRCQLDLTHVVAASP